MATAVLNVMGSDGNLIPLYLIVNASDVNGLTSLLSEKVDKVTGKSLSSNDYTTAEKNKLYEIEAQANKTIVDNTLSLSSTNPVQNKVVNEAIELNATKIMTAYGGIVGKNKLDINLAYLKSINNASGATWSDNVYTYNGISYTVNDDNTIKVNGTLSGSESKLYLFRNWSNEFVGDKLTGCPSGGGDNNYQIRLEQESSPYALIGKDSGNGTGISDNTSSLIFGYITIKQNMNNALFKPMICTQADYASSIDYQTAAMTNIELTEAIRAIQRQLSGQ